MCFSATASFSTAAMLMPVAAYTIGTALKTDRRYLGFAVFPLFFGLQQALEGGLWLAIGQDDAMRSRVFALGFLFFAYFVWPFLVPVASYLVERKSERRGAFLAFSGFGMLLGLTLFVPLLFDPDSLPLKIVRHSIDYNSQLIWADIVPYVIIRIIYAGIVCIPLLLSSEKQIRVFGAIITLSVILGFVFAHYAFTSVWCFMAAIVSVYLAFVMYGVGKR